MPPCDAQRPTRSSDCSCPPLADELSRLQADLLLAGVEGELNANGSLPRSPWLLDPRLRTADLRAQARSAERALRRRALAGPRPSTDG